MSLLQVAKVKGKGFPKRLKKQEMWTSLLLDESWKLAL